MLPAVPRHILAVSPRGSFTAARVKGSGEVSFLSICTCVAPSWPGQSTVHRNKGGSCNLEDAKRQAEAGLPGTVGVSWMFRTCANSWQTIGAFLFSLPPSLPSSLPPLLPFGSFLLPSLTVFGNLRALLSSSLLTFLSCAPLCLASVLLSSFLLLVSLPPCSSSLSPCPPFLCKAQRQQEDIATTQLRQQARQLRQHGKLLETLQKQMSCLLSSLA